MDISKSTAMVEIQNKADELPSLGRRRALGLHRARETVQLPTINVKLFYG